MFGYCPLDSLCSYCLLARLGHFEKFATRKLQTIAQLQIWLTAEGHLSFRFWRWIALFFWQTHQNNTVKLKCSVSQESKSQVGPSAGSATWPYDLVSPASWLDYATKNLVVTWTWLTLSNYLPGPGYAIHLELHFSFSFVLFLFAFCSLLFPFSPGSSKDLSTAKLFWFLFWFLLPLSLSIIHILPESPVRATKYQRWPSYGGLFAKVFSDCKICK